MERISVLALDVGTKRIGVAGCDGLGLFATGLTTIKRTSFVRDIEQLQHLVKERQATQLLVGLPYTTTGELSKQARQIQKFAQKVGAALQLPVEYIDERLTSVEAEERMIAQNLSPSRQKATVDRIAAAIILQQWLDERRRSLERAKADI
ncbi:Holliday junction resolvase RuvX [Oscillatoria sp. FACHB-1406]|uniref:Holliday junction resolvase RuvX n=1 Tax=Oscillatoria sp. FACHB-1406 TaxID=2692846 RepID=UPI001685D5ED|nr:Holliday junction resolvase RuvX [Oscillatoria sp. FACHB-1406]MBD2578722.1 Holliday junction resolvase RuvX [Oscillatoria sp. FACHB-1406]